MDGENPFYVQCGRKFARSQERRKGLVSPSVLGISRWKQCWEAWGELTAEKELCLCFCRSFIGNEERGQKLAREVKKGACQHRSWRDRIGLKVLAWSDPWHHIWFVILPGVITELTDLEGIGQS